MLINKDIVMDIVKKTECPISEMFWTKDDNRWFVCFEEDVVINNEEQITHLDKVLEEIEKYSNIENIVNEIYVADEENSYFEQITFEWKEPKKEINNQCKECYYYQKSTNIFDFHDETDYCFIYQKKYSDLNKDDIRFCKKFKTQKEVLDTCRIFD